MHQLVSTESWGVSLAHTILAVVVHGSKHQVKWTAVGIVQGMVTPICTVVTAKTGLLTIVLLLHHLTSLDVSQWTLTRCTFCPFDPISHWIGSFIVVYARTSKHLWKKWSNFIPSLVYGVKMSSCSWSCIAVALPDSHTFCSLTDRTPKL